MESSLFGALGRGSGGNEVAPADTLSMPRSAALRNLLLGEIEKKAERPIDHLRILEGLSHVGIQQDHIRPLLVVW